MLFLCSDEPQERMEYGGGGGCGCDHLININNQTNNSSCDCEAHISAEGVNELVWKAQGPTLSPFLRDAHSLRRAC